MTDWSKVKVVDLKAELKRRGLPQTGLKPALVERLHNADAEAAAEPEQQTTPVPSASGPQAPLPVEAPVEPPPPASVPSPSLAPQVTAAVPSVPVDKQSQSYESNHANAENDEAPIEAAIPATSEENQRSPPLGAVAPSESDGRSPGLKVGENNIAPDNLEETRKRKRRSQSPPPVAEEVAQKKAKQDQVTAVLFEGDKVNEATNRDADKMDEDNPKEAETTVNGQDEVTVGPTKTENDTDKAHGDVLKEVDDAPMPDAPPTNVTNDTAASPKRSPPPTSPTKKASPTDTRFKGLFSKPDSDLVSATRARQGPEETGGASPRSDEEEEDRETSPALHPATSALYIRDFMRPLNPQTLKDYLVKLATPRGSEPGSDSIQDFFLDPIRTHALVMFSSVSTASRVRSAIHDRVWPNERTRKPLWADFIPAEQVKQWIEIEQGPSGGGRSTKRWEVVYEDPEHGSETTDLVARLREVGSGTNGQGYGPGRGVHGAPSGPRRPADGPELRAPAPAKPGAVSHGANIGFSALDTLFKSTAAKPKLYFLPVAKRLADKRLDTLEEMTSGGGLRSRGGGVRRYGDEMRRYTFEDGDRLVDRGPEIGGGGGGGGGRGGYGGYRGRGGWRGRGRGDAYAPSGSWRDRGGDRW